MTIRFAPSNQASSSVIVRTICARMPLRAINDNSPAPAKNPMLNVALRHFAEHGLGAANRARANAQAAREAGDPASYDRWLAICRTLDRRMADAFAAGTATAG